MTSAEFYKAVDQVLRRALESQGFSRMKSTSSAWVKPLGQKYVMLEIEKGVKHKYSKATGGKFKVWFHLLTVPETSSAHSETSISFLRYYSDEDLAELKQIRQKVLQKILSRTKFESDFDKSLLEMSRPLLELGLNHDFNRRQPWPLEYLDTEDVTTWAKFIALKVPASFEGISKEGDLALSYK